MEKKRPLIIDCDPGIDDAQCIMMLKGCGLFDIRGITPVHGNVPLAKTARNALFLNDYYGIHTKVVPGAGEAILVRYPRAEYAHGLTGLGNMEFSTEGLSFGDGHAWDLIWEQANLFPGELELIAVGPLTNIALTVLKYPEIVRLVKRLVIMGGAATAGNATPYAEFNIWQDPHAAKIVFHAGFDLTVVDLDCCYTGYLDLQDQAAALEIARGTSLRELMEGIVSFEEENLENWAATEELKQQFRNQAVFCDAVAAAVLIRPEIAVCTDQYATVDVDGAKTIGQTVVDWFGFLGQPNIHLARSVDRDAYVKLYLDCLRSYGKEN